MLRHYLVGCIQITLPELIITIFRLRQYPYIRMWTWNQENWNLTIGEICGMFIRSLFPPRKIAPKVIRPYTSTNSKENKLLAHIICIFQKFFYFIFHFVNPPHPPKPCHVANMVVVVNPSINGHIFGYQVVNDYLMKLPMQSTLVTMKKDINHKLKYLYDDC